MKKIVFFFCLSISIFASCSLQNTEIEHITVQPTSIYDSIESRMPGKLLLCNQYIIWTDPLSSDNQAHIIDLSANKEIGKVVNRGNGPEEFSAPNFTCSSQKELIVYDSNNGKMAYFSLDSIHQKKNPLLSLSSQKTENRTRLIEIENEGFITFNPKAQYPFLLNDEHPFGKFPFDEAITNMYDVSQGNIAYNPNNGYFIFSTMSFPYMAAYQNKKDGFELIWEKRGESDYSITEDRMILNEKRNGAAELTLTKDYIVTLQRDYQSDPMDESKVGRDFTKIPQTLFLYDYNSNLKKVVHLNMPILRITSDPESNTVYAIAVDPEFTLIRCELSD